VQGNVSLTANAGTIAINNAINLDSNADATRGNLTLNGTSVQNATGVLNANGLELLGAGNFTLNVAANTVGLIAGNTSGSVTFTDTDAIAIVR